MPPEDPRSDEALVAALNRGDHAAFNVLYHRHRDWTFRLALRFTRSEADALDVLQDTFSYLLGKFPGFVLTARLTTFLYPAVKHNAMALQRRQKTFRLGGASLDGQSDGSPQHDPPAPTSPAPADDPTSQRRADLAQILSCLPEPQREVVLLRFVHDMSMEEIAAAMSIPTGTVKSRLHHALHTLRADPLTLAYFQTRG